MEDQHHQPSEEAPNREEEGQEEQGKTNAEDDIDSTTLITAKCAYAVIDNMPAEDEMADTVEEEEEIEHEPDSKPTSSKDEANVSDFPSSTKSAVMAENSNSVSSEFHADAKRSAVVPLVFNEANLTSSLRGAAAANSIEPANTISPSSSVDPSLNQNPTITPTPTALADRKRATTIKASNNNNKKAPNNNNNENANSDATAVNEECAPSSTTSSIDRPPEIPKSSGLSLATPYGEVSAFRSTTSKSSPPGAQYLASPNTASSHRTHPSASIGGSTASKSSSDGAFSQLNNNRHAAPSGAYAVRQSSGGELIISGRGGLTPRDSTFSSVSTHTINNNTNQNVLSGDGSTARNSNQCEITSNVPIQAELAEPSQDIEAIVEERVEERIRQRDGVIAVAEVADTRKRRSHLLLQIKRTQAYKLLGFILIVAVIGSVLVGVFVSKEFDENEQTIENDQETTENGQSTEIMSLLTIEQVQNRDILRCGASELSIGFAFRDITTGNVDGFLIEICRALAMIVLGDPEKFEIVVINDSTRFQFLHDREIDVLTWTTTVTMGRDVFESHSDFGMTFSAPYYYTGAAFAGEPTFVDCAEKLDSFTGPCRDLAICVREGTTHDLVLDEIFRGPEKVFAQDIQGAVGFLENGKCNVMVGDSVEMPEAAVRLMGYTGPYKLGTTLFSKEPLAIATRDGDPAWSNMANMVIESLITAEALNITQDTVESDFATLGSKLDDEEFATFFVDVISTIGNMAEVFERHLGDQFPRKTMNLLNNGDGGLIYSLPFGDVEKKGELAAGGVLESILDRQKLKCGVSRRGPGFAEFNDSSSLGWSGMDIEFCIAVSAALFSSRHPRDQIEFIEIDTKDRLAALARGDIDLLAGERVTLQSLWWDPGTETGFSFSPPYFYGEEHGDSFALATLQDSDFSDFVFWVVMSTFYAEENDIMHESSTELPIVSLFGESLKQMFLDSIWEVGSYGDIYNRTVQSIYPRTGRNMLNLGTTPQMVGFPLM